MSKELWFAQYERAQAEFMAEHDRYPTDAEDMALAEKAHKRLRANLADMADIAKKRARGE